MNAPPISFGPDIIHGQNIRIEEDVQIGRGTVLSDTEASPIILRTGARIGAGAVIAAGVEIGRGAQIRDGAVVLNAIPPNAIAEGNPAQVVGYTTALPQDVTTFSGGGLGADSNRGHAEIIPLEVGQAAIYRMPQVLEASRGNLTVGEIERDLPFLPKRYFAVYDVPSEKLRGEHAHRICHQFLICMSGSCRALLDDGENRQEVVLSRPDIGLYLPPMIWGTQYDYTRDAVLLVFASHAYDNADYIRDYETFRAELDAAR
ncbi:WxcM-like domain-containing protein [Rhodobacteraceae bacterium F11138]|nr:WxcM-like domain-containing protein [Rhodobacteraceae bacterium F11138]